MHEAKIRETWGDQVYIDYEGYLVTCVKAFANHWSSDVRMKLRNIVIGNDPL
jgi:cyclopropane-fatty-acyl-phospholipid synthase